MNDAMNDGGPAFPCAEDHKVAADIPWTCGMSKRELFAVILMHAEMVTGGVNSENAQNAADAADALLAALAAPKEPEPEPVPAHLTYNPWAAPALEHLAIKRLAKDPHFLDLPVVIRDFVTLAMSEIAKADDGIPF